MMEDMLLLRSSLLFSMAEGDGNLGPERLCLQRHVYFIEESVPTGTVAVAYSVESTQGPDYYSYVPMLRAIPNCAYKLQPT